jgi:hypothetical protein
LYALRVINILNSLGPVLNYSRRHASSLLLAAASSLLTLSFIVISPESFIPRIGGDKFLYLEVTGFTNGTLTSFKGIGQGLANTIFVNLLNMGLNKGLVSFHVNVFITCVDGKEIHRIINISPINGIMTEQLLSHALRGVASSLTGLNRNNPIASVKIASSFSV